jgi:hypothetical protein
MSEATLEIYERENFCNDDGRWRTHILRCPHQETRGLLFVWNPVGVFADLYGPHPKSMVPDLFERHAKRTTCSCTDELRNRYGQPTPEQHP